MAHIVKDELVVEFSKLFKDGNDQQYILSEDQVATLVEVIEATVAELLEDPTLVVEVVRKENR